MKKTNIVKILPARISYNIISKQCVYIYVITQRRKEQKRVVIEHKAKIYTAARYFAIKIGCK